VKSCVNCSDPYGHLHHAIPKSICPEGRHEPLNHIRLCFRCHMGWHERSVTIYRNVFSDAAWEWLVAHIRTSWLDTWYPPRPTETPF
jgi:5-methylcytosine-specific restriction endonuclease McrA